jgi:hypothetical protein
VLLQVSRQVSVLLGERASRALEPPEQVPSQPIHRSGAHVARPRNSQTLAAHDLVAGLRLS